MTRDIKPTITRRGALCTLAAIPAAAVLGWTRAGRAATIDEIRSRGTMTVATEDDYQPFEFTKDGVVTGYDVELLQGMQKAVPFKVQQEMIPWTGVLPGVTTGKYDAAVTAILVTQERMKMLDFTSPVAETIDFYMKRTSDKRINAVKDLSGLTLGVEAGSAMLKLLPQLDEMLQASGGHLGKVVEYQGYPEAYADLASSRLDYVVNTLLSVRSVADAKPNLFTVGQAVSKPTYIAWAVQKGNAGLLKAFNDYLAKARADGSMYALQKKWFGTTFEDMPVEPSAQS